MVHSINQSSSNGAFNRSINHLAMVHSIDQSSSNGAFNQSSNGAFIQSINHLAMVHSINHLAMVHSINHLAMVHSINHLAMVHSINHLAMVHSINHPAMVHSINLFPRTTTTWRSSAPRCWGSGWKRRPLLPSGAATTSAQPGRRWGAVGAAGGLVRKCAQF